jgi:hypothetical protein
MHVKIHKSYRNVVAICDSDLIGKYFSEGKRQLDLREGFYKGEEVSLADLINLIEKQALEDATFNIVGKESINASIKAGLITPSVVDKIAGIPFALTLI